MASSSMEVELFEWDFVAIDGEWSSPKHDVRHLMWWKDEGDSVEWEKMNRTWCERRARLYYTMMGGERWHRSK